MVEFEFRRERVVNKICGCLREQQEIAINLTEMIHLAEEKLKSGDMTGTDELRDYLFLLDDTRQIKENHLKHALQEFRQEVTMATVGKAMPVAIEI